tara:strand:+ start:716 stop:883 length:168 start_codon:yes stop_codon:yes gene_type:complete
MIKEDILDFLVCLRCKGNLKLNKDYLECHKCNIKYPIIDSIPRMVEDAIKPMNGK